MASRLLDGLNPRQLEAVTTTEGPLLVLAGAGTGKTRVVTARIGYLLSRGVEAQNILAVTFTNKAAREMHERVTGLVGAPAAKKLLVSTFHSFAVRMLRRYAERLGFSSNFTIIDEEDQQSLLRDVMRQLGVSEKQLSPKRAGYIIGDWKNRGLSAEAADAAACDTDEEIAALIYARMAEEMKRRSVIDFDDMILLVVKLLGEDLETRRECQDRFRYLLVDEYQDTNSTQYQLIRFLSGARRNLCVVGDDDQSIYGWRGAQARNILDFAKDYPGARVVTLEQNYRSVNTILKAANSVIRNNPDRKEKQLWSALGEGEPIKLYRAEDERDEEGYIGRSIADLLSRGAKPETVAILVRANTHATASEIALRQRKIPYRVVGTRSFFDRREARDLIAYVKVIANPRDDGALLRVINTPPRGIGKATQDILIEAALRERKGVYEFLKTGDFSVLPLGKSAAAVAEFCDIMKKLDEDCRIGVNQALRNLTERISYQAHIQMEHKEGLDAQIRWNVVESLMKLANTLDQKVVERRLEAFLEVLALDSDSRHNDKKDEAAGVWILTVHAAKGLEFDHVFLMAAEDDVFPHKNSVDEESGKDTIDEERRLFYVALTRARRFLTMTMAEKRTKWGRIEQKKASRFIDEIDDGLVDIIIPSLQGPATETVAQDFLSRLKNLTSNPPGKDRMRDEFGL